MLTLHKYGHTSMGHTHNDPKYLERQAFANSVDLDQMPQKMVSDQGLHYLPYMQQYFRHINR